MNEDGHTSSIRDKILTFAVKAGWNEGTRIMFPKEGDQACTNTLSHCVFKLILVISECTFSPQGPNNIPADIVFVIRQKPHPRFVRQNDELYYTAHISLEKVKKKRFQHAKMYFKYINRL